MFSWLCIIPSVSTIYSLFSPRSLALLPCPSQHQAPCCSCAVVEETDPTIPRRKNTSTDPYNHPFHPMISPHHTPSFLPSPTRHSQHRDAEQHPPIPINIPTSAHPPSESTPLKPNRMEPQKKKKKLTSAKTSSPPPLLLPPAPAPLPVLVLVGFSLWLCWVHRIRRLVRGLR